MKCAKLFQAHLDSKNYNYTVKTTDKATVVTFPYGGKDTKCFFTGDDGEYLSLYTVIESVPKEKTAALLATCNELNSQYKWVTYYLDSDNDVIAHCDAKLSVKDAAEEAMEMLVRNVKIIDDTKASIMKAIYA